MHELNSRENILIEIYESVNEIREMRNLFKRMLNTLNTFLSSELYWNLFIPVRACSYLKLKQTQERYIQECFHEINRKSVNCVIPP